MTRTPWQCAVYWAARTQLALRDLEALAVFDDQRDAATATGIAAGGDRCCGTRSGWHEPWCSVGPWPPRPDAVEAWATELLALLGIPPDSAERQAERQRIEDAITELAACYDDRDPGRPVVADPLDPAGSDT